MCEHMKQEQSVDIRSLIENLYLLRTLSCMCIYSLNTRKSKVYAKTRSFRLSQLWLFFSLCLSDYLHNLRNIA